MKIKDIILESLEALKIEIDKYGFNIPDSKNKLNKIDEIINGLKEETILIYKG